MPLIEELLYTTLTGDSGVFALVALGVRPHPAPLEIALPFVTYRMVSDVPRTDIEGKATGVKFSRFQLNSFGTSYGNAKLLAEAVRLALDASGFAERVNSLDLYDEDTRTHYTAGDYLLVHIE
jgi:hypothetical protein